MTEHTFEIQVSNFDDSIRDDLDAFGELASKLQELGEADMGLGLKAGAVLVDIWRDDCDSAKEALIKSIRELDKLGLTAVRIAPDDFVTSAELAERLKRTSANIAQLISGDRGAGGFPAPRIMQSRKSRVYSYLKVLTWSIEAGQDFDLQVEHELRRARTIKTANDALGLIETSVIANDRLHDLIAE